jgi:lysozyme
MDKILGVDVSYWQTNAGATRPINFVKAKDSNVKFAFIRAHSGYKIDTRFVENWKSAKDAEILRGAYHYAILDKTTFNGQITDLVKALKSDSGELPIAVDLEKINNQSFLTRTNMIDYVKKFQIAIKEQLNKNIILYTNPDVLMNYLKPIPDWMLNIDLWIANYTTAEKPYIGQFANWKFWQYSNKGVGKDYGVDSASIDLNWFNGSYNDLLIYAGKSPLPEPITIEQRLTKLENWAITQGFEK